MISYKNGRERKRRDVLWQVATVSGGMVTMRERALAVFGTAVGGLTRRRVVDYCRVAAAL